MCAHKNLVRGCFAIGVGGAIAVIEHLKPQVNIFQQPYVIGGPNCLTGRNDLDSFDPGYLSKQLPGQFKCVFKTLNSGIPVIRSPFFEAKL